MYCSEATVRTLCINVRSNLDTDFITAQAGMVDALIDARLAESFYWPNNPDGTPANDPPPTLIIQIANRLTAAYIEQTKYAINANSGQIDQSPYAAKLEKTAMEILEKCIRGEMILSQLTQVTPLRREAPAQRFFPIKGTLSTGNFARRRI